MDLVYHILFRSSFLKTRAIAELLDLKDEDMLKLFFKSDKTVNSAHCGIHFGIHSDLLVKRKRL